MWANETHANQSADLWDECVPAGSDDGTKREHHGDTVGRRCHRRGTTTSTNVTNSAKRLYFENFAGEGQIAVRSGSNVNFTQFITANSSLGTKALGTVPVLGWVSQRHGGSV